MIRKITQLLLIVLVITLSTIYVFANSVNSVNSENSTSRPLTVEPSLEAVPSQSQNLSQSRVENQNDLANKPESEIPLNLNKSTTSTSASSSSSKAVLSLVILLTMVGVSYYFVKKYRYSNSQLQDNLNIKILTQHHLGPKKSLAVIRIAGESILIGVTDHQINHIKTLALIDDEVPQDQALPQNFQETLADPNSALNLNSSLKANFNSNFNSSLQTGSRAVFIDQQEDDFSFAQIKNQVVDKVKSMRNS